ncbi:MAG: hypothetical protein ACYC2G_07885 [Gemmatimonadaceae bacterium]
MGGDHHLTGERLVRADGTTEPAGDIPGYSLIARRYLHRHRLPLARA